MKNNLPEKIHWTTREEMLFSPQNKYMLELPKEFPFRIIFYQFDATHPIVPNYHDFYEISCFFEGEAVYHITDKKFVIQAGSIVFIQAGLMHTVGLDIRKPLLSASIYFMPELICYTGVNPWENSYLLPFICSNGSKPPMLQQKDLDFSLWQYILDMYREYCDAGDFYQLALKNQLCDFLLKALKAMKRTNMIPRKQFPPYKIKRLRPLLEYIQHHYAQPVTLIHLADMACMNTSYFCRYFKQVIGLSPIHYILRYRIDKAKEMLLNTSCSITEVSSQVGFSSQSYFNLTFKKFTTMSPSRFRQKYATVESAK